MQVPMGMPKRLAKAIERSLEQIRESPQHVLPPHYRWVIYRVLGSFDGSQTSFSRVRLAILSAQKALAVWQREEPNNARPQELINLAAKVLRNEALPEEARIQAENAFDELALLAGESDGSENEKLSNRAQAAMLASIEALFEASGLHALDSEFDYQGKTDLDLDPWTSDAALHAANAFAGATWDIVQDSNRRKEFWEWWLLQAIPEVWASLGKGGHDG